MKPIYCDKGGRTMKALCSAALLVAAFVLFLPSSARSEIKQGAFELTPFIGVNLFEENQNLKDRPVYGARFGYNFTRYFAVEAALEFIDTRVDDRSITGVERGQARSPMDVMKINYYHVDAVVNFMPNRKLNPFVLAGFGGANFSPMMSDKAMGAFNLGAGAKYWLADNVALRFDLRDYIVTEIFRHSYHNLGATVGLTYAFGAPKKAVMAEPAVPGVIPQPNDTIAPQVIFIVPHDGHSTVPVKQSVKIAFSEDMDPATLNVETIMLKQGTKPVSGKLTYAASSAIFTPERDLEKGKTYTATVTTGVKDFAGNALATTYEWNFTTGAPPDTTPPVVSFTSPMDGAPGVRGDMQVSVAFSELMDTSTVNSSTFTVKQDNTVVTGKVTSSFNTAIFTPSSSLEQGKKYTATVTTGAKDAAGNALAKNYEWNFAVHSAPKIVPAVLINFEDNHFLFDSADISENGKTILNLNIEVLKKNPNMKIRIAGYTSASGTVEFNQKLSEKRATAVKDYMVKVGGIDPKRLSKIGFGESNPAQYEAVPSDIYSDAAKSNMRVLFEIIVE